MKVVQSCLTLCDPMDYAVHGILQARIQSFPSPRDLPNPGIEPRSLNCGWILYQLSHKGSLKILEWVVYPFSIGLPDPGIELGSPALQADSLPTELSGKPYVVNLLISSRANSSSMILIIILAFLGPLLVHVNFRTILQVLPTKALSEILLKLCAFLD